MEDISNTFNVRQKDINDSILLFRGSSKLVVGGVKSNGRVEVKHVFVPKSRLVFTFFDPTGDISTEILSQNLFKGTLVIQDFNFEGNVRILYVNWLEEAGYKIEGTISEIKKTMDTKNGAIDRAFFSIFNFPDVWTQVNRGSGETPGRMILPHSEYDIILNPIPALSGRYKKLKETNGYLITYEGYIVKKDKTVFKVKEIESILHALRWSFSFSQGRFIDINHIRGVLGSEEKLYHVKNYISCPTSDRLTWFDRHHPNSLYSIFTGISNLMDDSRWKDEITKALHWYFQSQNNLTIESSIILNQSALELLIWVYFTDEMKEYSRRCFKKMDFSKRLSLMLERIKHENLTFGPRTYLEKFGNKSTPRKEWWESFSQIRNFIIHPENKDRLNSESLRIKQEVREIGLQLIEVIILYLSDFKGEFVDRFNKPLWVGKIKSLSWNKSQKRE